MAQPFCFTGPLDVSNVAKLFKQLPKTLPGEVDVAAVTRCDSAGLALLLECRSRAGGTLKLTGANAQLLSLLDFYQLRPLLV